MFSIDLSSIKSLLLDNMKSRKNCSHIPDRVKHRARLKDTEIWHQKQLKVEQNEVSHSAELSEIIGHEKTQNVIPARKHSDHDQTQSKPSGLF